MDKYNVQIMSWGPFAEGKNDYFNNPVLKAIGKKYGKTVGQTALRFLLQEDVVLIPKTVHRERMEESARNGFTNATDAADYLVRKGIPFRDAHGIIGQLVLKCIEKDCSIEDLSISELKEICDSFDEDVYDAISLKTCVERRLTKGAPGAIKEAIRRYEEII